MEAGRTTRRSRSSSSSTAPHSSSAAMASRARWPSSSSSWPSPSRSCSSARYGPMSSIRTRHPVHIVLLAAGLLSLFPLYWLFLTSLSPAQYVVKVPPEIVPRELTLSNYQRLFETTPIVRWLVNTVVIAGVITAFHLLFDSMAGYAFAKRRFPGKNLMFWLVVSTLTVPAQVTLIPVFFILRTIGLLDTYPGVIVPGLADVFGVFLMKQFIQTLPSELEQAARLDGASEWQVYTRITLPLSKPAPPPAAA